MNGSESARRGAAAIHRGAGGKCKAGEKKQRTSEQQFIPGATGHSYPHACVVKLKLGGNRTLPQQIVCCQRIVHGIEKSLQRFCGNYKNCHFVPAGCSRCATSFRIKDRKPQLLQHGRTAGEKSVFVSIRPSPNEAMTGIQLCGNFSRSALDPQSTTPTLSPRRGL
jgi:hypothetical protein